MLAKDALKTSAYKPGLFDAHEERTGAEVVGSYAEDSHEQYKTTSIYFLIQE